VLAHTTICHEPTVAYGGACEHAPYFTSLVVDMLKSPETCATSAALWVGMAPGPVSRQKRTSREVLDNAGTGGETHGTLAAAAGFDGRGMDDRFDIRSKP
jgi:hypothetical protein